MENENLQKIDDILKRTDTDYSTAKIALENTNGDVLEAIIWIENQSKNQNAQTSTGKGEQIMNQIKDMLVKGNATKITIKKNNDVIVNLPITAGLIGAFIAPFLSAAGITAALLTQCSVEITQADGNVVDIGQKMDQGMDAVKDAMQDVKQGATEFRADVMKEATELKNDFTYSFNKNNDEL